MPHGRRFGAIHDETVDHTPAPALAPTRHQLGVGQVLLGRQACLGHGGGHTAWTCAVLASCPWCLPAAAIRDDPTSPPGQLLRC